MDAVMTEIAGMCSNINLSFSVIFKLWNIAPDDIVDSLAILDQPSMPEPPLQVFRESIVQIA